MPRRARGGRPSERLDTDQRAPGLEDVAGAFARNRAGGPAFATDARGAGPRAKPLPAHLPRDDVTLDIAGDICGCCGGALHAIGESVSEMLDWVAAQLRVVRLNPPKNAFPHCNKGLQAAAPERPVSRRLASPPPLPPVL